MKRNGMFSLAVFLTVTFMFLCGTALGAVEPANSLNRPHDPVVIKGEKLTSLIGEPIPQIRVFAARNGKLEVIPFQIDQRFKNGEWVYTHVASGKRFIRVNEAKEKEGLTPQDELVFMAWDCGDRVERAQWPLARHGMEIQVTDPVRGGKGYAYIFSMLSPPELSKKVYIKFAEKGRMILGTYYAFGFIEDPKGAVFDLMSFGDAMNVSVEELKKTDILDKLIFDLHFSFIFRGLRFSWNETDLHSGTTAYKSGPVRVLQKVWHSLDLVLGLKSPRVTRELMNYPGRTVMPTEVTVPFNPKGLLSHAEAKVTFDFSERISGSKMYHPQVDQTLIIDGKMSPLERQVQTTNFILDPKYPIWLAIGGNWGGIMGRVYPTPEAWTIFKNMKEKSQTQMVYLDDAKVRNPRENEPGSFGQVGGVFNGMGSVPKGKYTMMMVFFAKPKMDADIVKQLLEVDDHPIMVDILN